MSRYHTLIACCLLFHIIGDRAGGEPAARSIDRFTAAAWARDQVQPAACSDDAEFARRLYLDLIGRIPTRDEVQQFINDQDPHKRSQLIDGLLAGGEFDQHWRENLHVLLVGGPAFAGNADWRKWLEDSLRQNKKWDAMVRDILLARPEKPEEYGASHFLVSRLGQGEPGLDMATRDVSRFFFGVDIQCARCHKHPEVKEWKQESYWGMAAYLKRSYTLPVKGKTYLAERALGEVEYATKSKGTQTIQPVFLTGEKLTELAPRPKSGAPENPKKDPKPMPLMDDSADYLVPPETAKDKTRVPVPKVSRRERLAATAVNGQNPYFKRAAVNYVWAKLMGRGLVEPVDQMHEGNPPSHPELLQWLAEDFIAHQFDLRCLIRTITNSQTYQLSSRYPSGSPRLAEQAYACAAVRPLTMHQLTVSLLVASGYLDTLKASADASARSDTSALRAKLVSQHLNTLLALEKELDSGAEPYQAGVREALFETNSPAFSQLVAKGGLAARLAMIQEDNALSREAFLAVLSRQPTAGELESMGGYLRVRSGRRLAACEQMVWSLVTSSEFRFNH